jgi:hypothetical protein
MKFSLKNIILSILVLVLVCLNIFAQSVNPKSIFKADLQSKRIASGTIIQVRFLENLSSFQNKPGDSFTACLEEDIKLNKKTVLPAGTFMRGTVNNVKKSKRFKLPASMYIDFDHLVTPDGRQLGLSLRLINITTTKDGVGLSGGGSYRTSVCDNFDDSAAFVKKSVDCGNDIGDKFLYGYPKLIITPITATGGFCASTLMFTGKSIADLFRKGNNALIQQNQVISGRLLDPIDIPLN